MASIKERARWERWYENVTERMQRQKASIDRLVLINTESMAALHQIAGDPDIKSVKAARARAQEALDRIQGPAAAEADAVEASAGDEPVPDPRRNH